MKERARKQEELRQEGKTKNLLMTLGASLGNSQRELGPGSEVRLDRRPQEAAKDKFL